MKLFPAFYFGPIDYFARMVQTENYLIEKHENFQKQTYRNRCLVLGANGVLRLAIPILHNGQRQMKDIQPSYDYDWQKEHFKSLVAAYKSSPYFEFYEDDLAPIYEKQEKYLLDLNLKTIDFIQSKLKLEVTYSLTDQYETVEEENDYRNLFKAKEERITLPEYYQVFDGKFEFQSNLSILDLLFNEGPAASTYLKNIKNLS
ncbi:MULTISPECIES: WbqC family protein [Weeksella]|uniref:WbqC family protein n=1 Tax=Weeksella TaxID=1013 RepID=UPI0008A1D879|nr:MULTISPECIES: WbqC family protein [Weeksella]MDK7374716.1 WbqC family protein [Weeksella virosa]MDK7675193.1 WbqC family protein [Weeksella virosa]OFM85395.1 hypothetical protein HMPREF2660_07500 [Weeksella sp. HMSC059D05]SUP55118.1 WbqC-like protein family [Weeksella virosa]